MRNYIAFVSFIFILIGLPNTTSATSISLHDTHAGNIGYAIIGGSELTETNGYSNCGNGTASSATLSLPAGVTVEAAYLYWYAMESNSEDGFSTIALSNTAPVTFPGASSTITASRNFSDSLTDPGFGTWVYKGYFSDISSQIQALATVNGSYTVDVVGGASNSACSYTQENARGWSIIVVYEDPAIADYHKIYIYDGMAGFLSSDITVPVSGYNVPALQTSGSMAVISIQGDPGIPGEHMNTSDTSFPDFPSDYANGDHGGGLDIDIMTGNFLANSTSMDINAGSNQDLILITNIVVSISSDPAGCFDPILIDDNNNHTIWKITGANDFSDLTGVNLNDGVAPDLVQVGSYHLGYDIQDLAYDNNGDIWGIAVGSGSNGTTVKHAYIGQLVENAGTYSFTNVVDLDASSATPTYHTASRNHGKALVWDPDNNYFIFEANYIDKDAVTRLKAYDPVTQTVIADPWGTGNSELHLTMPVTQHHNYMHGLAFSPDGILYGAVGNVPSILIALERNAQHKLTGNYTVVGVPGLDVGLRNVEILDFTSDGQLLLVESDGGVSATQGKVFTVDVNTGTTAVIADLDNGFGGTRDWEGVIFCNAPYEPRPGISGIVFQDNNTNDNLDNGDVSLLSIQVSIYNDMNNDGSIDVGDTLLSTTISDANGDYTFSNLADGSYLLQVDDNDTDLPANIMLGGTNPLAVVVNGSMVAGQDFPFDPSACSALSGEVSEVAAGVSMQIASGDQVFVASSSPAPNQQGHFRAYKVLSNGAIKIASEWDADDEMDATDRQLQLFSTDTLGSKILFNLLDNDAFSRTGADPTVDKIKEYSFDPSVDADIYLAGRASGSYLGTLDRGNDVALLENRINTWSYLDDPDYRPFALAISSRPQKALVTSDDGFVYAFNQSGGDLAWGWMPRQLVQELKNYSSFQDHHYMLGKLDTLEFKHLGSYGAYVVGSYKNGLGHYTLKLDTSDNDNLEAVVWDQDYSQLTFDEAPNQGERDYFKDGNGNTYTTYIISKNNLSTLVIKKLGDNTAATEVALNFHVTSTPFVMPDFGDSQAPAKKAIYLGAEDGKIKRAALLNGISLETTANIKTALEGAAVGTLGDNDQSITFLGAASAETGNGYYMRAQSEERLTVLKYNSGSTHWDHIWTSYVTGAGTWDNSNSYTADNSGIPTDNDSDGFLTDVTENGIQSIPTGARITDAAQIVSGTVILPVSVATAGSCSGKAYYYLYKLNAGVFPDAKFTQLDHSPIIGDIALGYGEPKRVQTADITSTNQTIGYGNTDQKQNHTTGVTASFIINDTIATGIRGWKERTQ